MSKSDHTPCMSVALAVKDPLGVSVNWKALHGFVIVNERSARSTALADVLLHLGRSINSFISMYKMGMRNSKWENRFTASNTSKGSYFWHRTSGKESLSSLFTVLQKE